MSDEPQPKPPIPGWARSNAPRPEGADKAERAAAAGGGPKGLAGAKGPKRPRRTGWRRLIPTWRMVLTACVVGVLLLVGGFFLGYSLVKIPSANALATQQSNVYLYADGSVLARDGEVNRENVGLSRVSKDAQHAVLAAEDRDFYTESAVDPSAMVRAAWNTATGKGKQSGSTITQQYVKNYYLAQEQTVTRKVKEFFIAIKLDREKTKDEILEGYLNTSFFGRGAYGIQAAAQAYYGVDATELDAAQGAYLASLLNAPSQYDVVAHPENRPAAEARWNYVLDGMVEKGWLTASERASLTFPVPKETTVSTGMSGQRGYVVQIVKDHLVGSGVVAEEELDRGGYRITTTLHKDKQDAFVEAVEDNLMSKLDPKNRKVDSYVRAGGASVDPRTGKVVAMYNGIDYVKQYTPNATRRDFQVGSTFKPFVFTSAVDNHSQTQDGRVITPNTIYDGTSERPVEGWSGGHYAPENEDHHDYGDITVQEATDKSVNAVYAQMAVDVGSDKVRQTAIDLGLSPRPPSWSPARRSRSAPPTPASWTWRRPTPPSPTTAGTARTRWSRRSPTGTRRSGCPSGASGRPSAGRPRTPRRTSCAASSATAPPPPPRPRAGRWPARPARRRRTRPPGSPGTPRAGDRRRRDGPGPGHRRPQVAVRRDGPAPGQRRRRAHGDLGPVHPGGAPGRAGHRLRAAAAVGRRREPGPAVRRAVVRHRHRRPVRRPHPSAGASDGDAPSPSGRPEGGDATGDASSGGAATGGGNTEPSDGATGQPPAGGASGDASTGSGGATGGDGGDDGAGGGGGPTDGGTGSGQFPWTPRPD